MVVCGIEPFRVALNMAPAIPASSGKNWLGSGRRDRRSSCSAVVGVDIARFSLLNLGGVFVVSVVRRHNPGMSGGAAASQAAVCRGTAR
jgi:hypothetical protein